VDDYSCKNESTCENGFDLTFDKVDFFWVAIGFFTDSLLVINNCPSHGFSKWGEKAVHENVTILLPNFTKIASS
jgi:hypothetical protein